MPLDSGRRRQRCRELNLDSHGSHQIQSIASLHHARLEPVIEVQFTVLQRVGEVNVDGAAAQSVGDVGQRQIVRGDPVPWRHDR